MEHETKHGNMNMDPGPEFFFSLRDIIEIGKIRIRSEGL